MKKCIMAAAAACCFLTGAYAQFAPQAGFEGTTAIYKDSALFVNWATGCTLNKGWQDIADTSLGKAQVGDETYVPGKAGNGVVSLGDGGIAVITFEKPLMNGAGYDFAVFENGFIDQTLNPGNAFLELAFVEVSSDGINYFRFAAESLNDTAVQRASFEAMNAVKIHNFAGKYIANYGTPFDLDELKNEPGLDVNNITHIKIIDVVGSINPLHGTRDSKGRIINDPYPTAFASGGFDLDGVGVIHQNNFSATESITLNGESVRVFPNPASHSGVIKVQLPKAGKVLCYDITGKKIETNQAPFTLTHELQINQPGVYLVKCISGDEQVTKRIVVQ